MIATAGRLPLDKRAKLYSMLWGGIDAFTALFIELMRTLEQLGFAEKQGPNSRRWCRAKEHHRRHDPAAARHAPGQGRSDQRAAADQRAINGAGRPARATVTALVAELKIVMTDSPWPFFAHTDLLDFPGARSRLKLTGLPAIRRPVAAGSRVAAARQDRLSVPALHRGRELTSMLLCMPPSVAEVKDLASMVKSWIDSTHGSTPRQRAQVRNALFLILTKFDLEFLEKGGETAESRQGKWDRRLHASLLELYGKDEWVGNWNGRPFANTLFLRNRV